MSRRRRLILLVWAVLAALPLSAQQTDSLVRLVYSDKGELLEIDGEPCRKLTGNTRFLHNGTYLLCDTALWHVNRKLIRFSGHVRIIQDRTSLTSDNADYLIDQDLAQFRGSLVELQDRDGNILRTRNLDYNTADSVAVFQDGGAMRDKDGQLIESLTGTYDARDRHFTFIDQVNMFTDSIFVKTSRLLYRADRNTAYFGYGTDAWQGENMLSANDGWYERDSETFLFRNRVHVMSAEREGWADTLLFRRSEQIVELRGHAVVIDTVHNAAALGGRMEYVDSLSRVTLTRRGAIGGITEEAGQGDTVWVGADTLVYRTLRRCDVDSLTVVAAQERLQELSTDAIAAHRQRAAEAAAQAAQTALENDPVRQANRPPSQRGGTKKPNGDAAGAVPGAASGSAPADTSVVPSSSSVIPSEAKESPPAADSFVGQEPPQNDSIPQAISAPLDTTSVGFAYGRGHVRLYRNSMQMLCDSLMYSDLDSLVRLFGEPRIWQESNRQYSSDSVAVVIKNRRMDRAHLMSNGFITIQETERYFDQIRGAELVAYFTPENKLRRFDALGGVDAVFFLQENDAFATVNKVQSKMLSAVFVNEDLDRIHYYEQVGNNAYPIVQLPAEERQLKGFAWSPELRPSSPQDVTPIALRSSERKQYASRPRAEYRQTEKYFPGYMDQVYREIARSDSLKAARARRNAEREAEREAERAARAADSLRTPTDSLSVPTDSLSVPTDSLRTPTDSLAAPTDSLATSQDPSGISGEATLTAKEQKRQEREAARLRKAAEREARWAAADARDAEKARLKAEKKLQRERARKRRELKKLAREREKEERLLEIYRQRYEKKLSLDKE